MAQTFSEGFHYAGVQGPVTTTSIRTEITTELYTI